MLNKTCYYTTGMLIKHFRIMAGKSQRGLAAEIDVSETTFSRWETDTSKPSAANLEKLEKTLGVSIRPGNYDPDSLDMRQDAPQVVMNMGLLCSVKAEVAALNTHIQLLSQFLGHMDPETN